MRSIPARNDFTSFNRNDKPKTDRLQPMKTIFKLSLLALFLPALTSYALTVTNIAQGCEAQHSMFLKSDGSLWAMGKNYFGQLGDGTALRRDFPPTDLGESWPAASLRLRLPRQRQKSKFLSFPEL